MWAIDAESQPCAIGHARGHRNPDGMTELTIAGAAAEDTRFGPALAAAAADLARAAQRNFEWNHGAAPGFAARHRDFGGVRVVAPGAFAEERIADTRHEIAD